MKKLMLFIFAFGAWSLGLQAQNDVYYIPSKKVNEVKVTKPSVTTVEHTYTEDNYRVGSQRNVDEYNRRGTSVYGQDTVYDNSQDLQSSVDQNDAYSYTKMIVRFHSPISGVVVSSPYYWDICYGDAWDVYYDSWAFGLPSWSFWTYAYDPWYYNRWYYRTCWDYTWGWYDPYWGAGYWGWHRPAYWGWNRPYYGGWGYAHHHHGSWGGSYAPGFGRVPAGGGRSYASNARSITRGSAGGRIIQGGNNYRSMGNSGERNFTSNNGALSKGFRVTGSDSRTNGTVRSNGGGGFSRGGTTNQSYSRGTTTTSRNSTYQQRNVPNRTMGSTQSSTSRSQSSTPVVRQQQSSPTRSSGMSSGSVSRGGGVSSGGGVSRGGGGGFSRGGGGRR